MKVFPTLEQLIEKAAKGGFSREDAQEVIGKNYEYLKSTYSESSKTKLIDIAYAIYDL